MKDRSNTPEFNNGVEARKKGLKLLDDNPYRAKWKRELWHSGWCDQDMIEIGLEKPADNLKSDGKLVTYKVTEEVSGYDRKIRAASPKVALMKYLWDDTEINPNASEWRYEFNIERCSPSKNS